VRATFTSQDSLKTALNMFKHHQFLIHVHQNKIHVLLKDTSHSKDILHAFFTAYHIQKTLKEKYQQRDNHATQESLIYATNNFTSFVTELEQKGWNLTSVVLGADQNRLRW